jgi:hypothetical protein
MHVLGMQFAPRFLLHTMAIAHNVFSEVNYGTNSFFKFGGPLCG